MLPTFEGLDPNLQAVGTTLFFLLICIFAAWNYVFGKRPPKPPEKEFSIAGQFSDMGPVKELVEQTGLLVQQMVRANIAEEATAKALEDTAAALERLAKAYEGQIAAEREELEIEAEVERRVDRQLRERRTRARRAKPQT